VNRKNFLWLAIHGSRSFGADDKRRQKILQEFF